MKRIRIVLGIVVGTLLVAVAAIWVFANPNRHRQVIQATLEQQLGRKVTLGEMSLGFLPLRFQVADLVIAEDPGIDARTPFVRADKVDIRIGLIPLLRGDIRVQSLELRRPGVELVKTRKGTWNVSTLGVRDTGTATPGSTNPSGKPAAEFALDKLTIVDGQVGMTDLEQNRPRTSYDHIDLTLLDYSAKKPFSFDLAAHIQGEGAEQIHLKGEAGPMPAIDPAKVPFRGTLSVNQVAIDDLVRFLDIKAVTKAKGILSGQSQITSQSGMVASEGKLKLEGAQFNDLDIGYPITLDYKLAAKTETGLVSIESAALQLGKTPLLASGSLNTATTPPVMDLKVKSGDVSISEIARLASAFGVAFAPGTSVAGRVSADVAVRGFTSKPVLTGLIAGRDLQISGQGIPQPVQVKAVDLTLSPTSIQSNEFNAMSGQTTVAAKFSLLQYASNSPSVDVGLRSPGATLPEIQSIAKAYGITGLGQISGAGALDFDLRAKGPLQSLSTADATKALNGVINIDFSPLKIAGFDAAHALGNLGGFAAKIAEQSSTDILRVTGRILVKNGIAQTDGLKAQLGIGNLAVAGDADLGAETLNLKLSAVFSKAFSATVGDSRAGGFMNAALTNAAGEIVLPAIVTGTFKQPRFAPDLKAVAELQKQKFLPSMDNPVQGIGNILGALTGKKNDSPEQPDGQKPSGLKGLLKSLGKKGPPY